MELDSYEDRLVRWRPKAWQSLGTAPSQLIELVLKPRKKTCQLFNVLTPLYWRKLFLVGLGSRTYIQID